MALNLPQAAWHWTLYQIGTSAAAISSVVAAVTAVMMGTPSAAKVWVIAGLAGFAAVSLVSAVEASAGFVSLMDALPPAAAVLASAGMAVGIAVEGAALVYLTASAGSILVFSAIVYITALCSSAEDGVQGEQCGVVIAVMYVGLAEGLALLVATAYAIFTYLKLWRTQIRAIRA